jgi:hypothetical protein
MDYEKWTVGNLGVTSRTGRQTSAAKEGGLYWPSCVYNFDPFFRTAGASEANFPRDLALKMNRFDTNGIKKTKMSEGGEALKMDRDKVRNGQMITKDTVRCSSTQPPLRQRATPPCRRKGP